MTTLIRAFDQSLTGIHAANPQVQLAVHRDPQLEQLVLAVAYPAPSGPASRDVWSDAQHTDWGAGEAITFQVKPNQPIRLSVSFLDANGVAYTAWADIEANEWQEVEIPFANIEPNPYFQPPGADVEAPMDVSEVRRIGFAPQSRDSGSLLITEFAITR